MISIRRLSAALIAWAAAATFAHADPVSAPGPTVLIGEEGYATTLTLLLRDGNYGAALALLESRPDLTARPDGLRLRAELLAGLGRVDDALVLLEQRLSEDPSDAVARFQLAEIQLTAGRFREARSAYRLAMSGDLDTIRYQIAVQRLAGIRRREGWAVSVSLSVAPDSNINAATSVDSVEMFGIPFELSDDARRRSGVSAAGSATASWRYSVSPVTSLAVEAGMAVTDAPGGAFDQAQVSLAAGPDLVAPAADLQLGLRLAGQTRWFGGEVLDDRVGLRTFGEWTASPNTVWRAAFQYDRVASARADALDGQAYGGHVERTRYLSPTTLWKASVGWTKDDLRAASQASETLYLSAGRLIQLPAVIVAYVEPYAVYRQFAGPTAAFGVVRKDRELGLSVRLSKRDWLFRGASPFVQMTLSRADSNVVLASFDRQRVEFGFTRDF